MSDPLRDRRPPRELAALGQVIETTRELGAFRQLAGIVADDLARLPADEVPAGWQASPVGLDLAFGWGGRGRRMPVLEGRVTARVPAVCQRCLAPFVFVLERDLRLLFAKSEAEVPDAGDYEVWETEGETIRPLDVVEEAMIMAIPLSAMHNSAECRPPGQEEAPGPDTVRPFADLKSRMRQEE